MTVDSAAVLSLYAAVMPRAWGVLPAGHTAADFGSIISFFFWDLFVKSIDTACHEYTKQCACQVSDPDPYSMHLITFL